MSSKHLNLNTVERWSTLLAFGLPKKNCYRYNDALQNPEIIGDSDFFVIVTRMFQGDALASYMFIICPDYVQRTSVDVF